MKEEIRLLEEEIGRLQQERKEREAALPAHTVRPHQIMAIEQLEDEINRKEAKLVALKKTEIIGNLCQKPIKKQ